jgi:hypothetical protein
MQRKCNKLVKLFSVFATKLSYSKEFVIRINRIFFRIKIYFIEFIRVTSEYDANFQIIILQKNRFYQKFKKNRPLSVIGTIYLK